MSPRAPSGVPDPDALVMLGRVSKPHGLRGEVRVFPTTDGPAAWDAALDHPLFFHRDSARAGVFERVRLRAWRPHQPFVLATFESVADRTDAEAMGKGDLWMERSALPALEQDAYYYSDLIGLRVLGGDDGAPLGEVERVAESGGQEQLVVVRADGRRFFVPFVAPIVGQVNLQAGWIMVDLPEGLIDLND